MNAHALTLALLQGGRPIVFEGVPGVGKSSLVRDMGDALRECAVTHRVVCHYERRNEPMLVAFKQDPALYGGWLQLVKLMDRQLVLTDIAHAQRADARDIHLIDRSIDGDLAFFLHNLAEGNIPPMLAQAYEEELTGRHFAEPLLVLYLTAPPRTLVERIEARGIDWEMELYDEAYFVKMDAAHRAAFARRRVPFVALDWSEEHTGGHVPHARCLQVLEDALRTAYATNWATLLRPSIC